MYVMGFVMFPSSRVRTEGEPLLDGMHRQRSWKSKEDVEFGFSGSPEVQVSIRSAVMPHCRHLIKVFQR